MRIPSSRNHGDFNDDRSMTPMIDVVFLLLIFFVCASVGQIREALLPTELAPGSISSDQPVEQPRPLGEAWVRLLWRDGRTVIEVNDQEYDDFEALRQTLLDLARLAPEIPVILDIDDEVPVGDVIRVYDTCREANFHSIRFAIDAAKL